jgi:hypothetical protein
VLTEMAKPLLARLPTIDGQATMCRLLLGYLMG